MFRFLDTCLKRGNRKFKHSQLNVNKGSHQILEDWYEPLLVPSAKETQGFSPRAKPSKFFLTND
ncbi:hypothetical protein BJP37_09270 [Moorena bouillonii PNG]|uniref:Uncharacterized protein n=1 Tax=Moorena bouillonii PNG TaxID=568701 RepID=A0A1U7MZR8_9CYAN|nr:hypothetical protein BJP37_09270 [Moorena bouillonii PNG]